MGACISSVQEPEIPVKRGIPAKPEMPAKPVEEPVQKPVQKPVKTGRLWQNVKDAAEMAAVLVVLPVAVVAVVVAWHIGGFVSLHLTSDGFICYDVKTPFEGRSFWGRMWYRLVKVTRWTMFGYYWIFRGTTYAVALAVTIAICIAIPPLGLTWLWVFINSYFTPTPV